MSEKERVAGTLKLEELRGNHDLGVRVSLKSMKDSLKRAVNKLETSRN